MFVLKPHSVELDKANGMIFERDLSHLPLFRFPGLLLSLKAKEEERRAGFKGKQTR